MTSDDFRVLLVAAEEDRRVALRKAVARAGFASEVDEEEDPDRALSRAVGLSDGYDVVIIERLRGRLAVELTGAMRSRGVTGAVLLVVGDEDGELERAALDDGATDVLTAADLAAPRFAHRVRAAVRLRRTDAETAKLAATLQSAGAARDELLSIVSHDLRSPLNAVALACDALEANITEAERKRYVAAIRRAGQRAERLLRDLLDVSRIEGGSLKLETRPLSARSLLEQTRSDHEQTARDGRTTLTVEPGDDPGQVLGDRDRLLQMLGNLVGNALKHAPGAAITMGATALSDGVELWVADQGPGIAAEPLAHVFDRFWQGRARRRSGAGLGLTIARGIVEAHGGQIRADSEAGSGTRFTVRLPRPATR